MSSQLFHLPLGGKLATAKDFEVLLEKQLQAVRRVLPEGKAVPMHQSPADSLTLCLEGRIVVTSGEENMQLRPGDLLYFPAHQPRAYVALEPSNLLIIMRTDSPGTPVSDEVDQASRDSFPASDAPAHASILGTNRRPDGPRR